MSVDAMKWAMRADVQRSSSKLVLLSLAHLVRFDASEWTAYASVEYLVDVTHLNRKTVLEALARLRALGVIEDTGLRAGSNRSSPVYRLCPDQAVEAHAAATPAIRGTAGPGLATEPPARPDAPEQSREDRHPASPPERDVDAGGAPPGSQVDEVAIEASQCSRVDRFQLRPRPRQPGPAAGQVIEPRAGTGASRLPAGWELPAPWRAWTARQRPSWDDVRIDAVAAMFAAYWRSKPGDSGLSADWFETWRLWVFRERDNGSRVDKPWFETWTGIEAKGRQLGVVQADGEPAPVFRRRVYVAAGLPPPS